MLKLNYASEVADLASALGLRATANPAERIIQHCREQVGDWIREAGGVTDIQALEKLICRKKSLTIVEIWSDAELDENIHRYVRDLRETGFATLKYELQEDDAYGCLLERLNVKRGDRDRYVAFIDCRGEKAQRRFFTRWHEIAHALTLVGQLELPVKRGPDGHPVEKLMDAIAGEIGFYEPLLQPALNTELDRTGTLTLDGIERIKRHGFSDASFQATLIACVRRVQSPLLLLEAQLRYKKSEMAQLNRARPRSALPEAKLRVVRSAPNEAARVQGLFIPLNFRVPKSSIISESFEVTTAFEASGSVGRVENLQIWQSQGKSLGNVPIYVETRRLMGSMLALIRPVDD